MAVHVSLFLFSKPAHELDREGEEIEATDVRALAGQMHERLLACADAIEKMTAAGWNATMMLYDVCLSHPYINTEAEARGRIEDLGLDPELFCFMEFDEEDDDWDVTGDGEEGEFEEGEFFASEEGDEAGEP